MYSAVCSLKLVVLMARYPPPPNQSAMYTATTEPSAAGRECSTVSLATPELVLDGASHGAKFSVSQMFGLIESEGFWQCCITLRITGCLDFVKNSKYKKTQCFRNWICFRLQMRELSSLLGPLERGLRFALSEGLDTVVVSLPLSKDANRFSFQNTVL
jgi:hypothetical protein